MLRIQIIFSRFIYHPNLAVFFCRLIWNCFIYLSFLKRSRIVFILYTYDELM